jgi:hypothetical protein
MASPALHPPLHHHSLQGANAGASPPPSPPATSSPSFSPARPRTSGAAAAAIRASSPVSTYGRHSTLLSTSIASGARLHAYAEASASLTGSVPLTQRMRAPLPAVISRRGRYDRYVVTVCEFRALWDLDVLNQQQSPFLGDEVSASQLLGRQMPYHHCKFTASMPPAPVPAALRGLMMWGAGQEEAARLERHAWLSKLPPPTHLPPPHLLALQPSAQITLVCPLLIATPRCMPQGGPKLGSLLCQHLWPHL